MSNRRGVISQIMVLLALFAALLLSGCAMALKPDFVQRATNDLGAVPMVYHRADWIQNVYGYPSFGEAFAAGRPQIRRGALMCTDDKAVFVISNRHKQAYDPLFEVPYADLASVDIVKKGAGRRLVLKEKKSIFTPLKSSPVQ